MPGEKQEAIGKEELEAVAACVKHGPGLLKVLKQTYKVETLPQLLSMEDAAFRTAGSTKEDKAVATIAKQMRSTGSAQLQAMQEPAIRVLLYELTEGARVRNPDCVRRQQLAAGLKVGEKKTTLACDEDSLWKAVAAQRGGRELPDEERGSSKLVRSLWESLQDQDGRRLPDVDLATVSSHAGKGYDGPTEASTDGGEGEEASGKKAKKEGPGGLGKYTLLRLLRVVFNSLAAVSSTQLTNDKKEPPKYDSHDGTWRVKESTGKTETTRLDATLAECTDACTFLSDRLGREKTSASVLAGFVRFWKAVKTRVNSAKSHHASVAAALRLAIVAYEQTDEVAEIATAAMPKTATKKPSVLNSDKKGEAGKRKRESPLWAKEAAAKVQADKKKKEEEAKKGKGKGKKTVNFGEPNSREGACKTYRRTGECKWGDKCTWRHTREDDSDAEDDRGI